MRPSLLAAILVWSASAQTVVKPGEIPSAEKLLAPRANEQAFRCDVDTPKAELNFGLRFQAGYVLHVPLIQYSATGNWWRIVVKVTPEGGEPTYLTDQFDLPAAVDPNYTGEFAGAFLVGEGKYDVDFAATDAKQRVCRREWHLDAVLGRSERGTKVTIPPHVVGDLSWAGTEAKPDANISPRRLTILMNGSEPDWSWFWQPLQQVIVPHTAGPHAESMIDYRAAILGILASLVEKLPGTAIRLVVFDLDQQKETLRQDNFTLKDMAKAAHAANNTDHWVVTVRELQEQRGPWALLESLVEREMHADEPSDAVLFLGPLIQPLDNMPAHLFQNSKGSRLPFFYLQYRLTAEPIEYGTPRNMGNKPPDESLPSFYQPDRLAPEVPDPIDNLVARLKGKTLKIHTPTEFAKAVDTIRRR